jgi:flagellar hook-associated protein 3 FlgL
MRVTHKMMIDQAVAGIHDSLSRITSLQTQASSGKKFQKPSDDPSTASSAFLLRSSIQASETFVDTSAFVSDWMSASNLAVSNTLDISTRALNLVQKGISSTSGADERITLAGEIEDLFFAAVEAGNMLYKGDYIFAGFKTKSAPFVVNGDPPMSVTYQGDAGVHQPHIAPGQTIEKNTPGNQIFSPVFASLLEARDALLSDNVVQMQTALVSLETSFAELNHTRARIGARLRQVSSAQEHQENIILGLKSLLSLKEDADLAAVLSDLSIQETVYQASLNIASRTLESPNLFDFLN